MNGSIKDEFFSFHKSFLKSDFVDRYSIFKGAWAHGMNDTDPFKPVKSVLSVFNFLSGSYGTRMVRMILIKTD